MALDRRALLVNAASWLLISRLALVVIPFPRLARKISWTVTRAAGQVAFKAVCLPEAIAARQMLNRSGVAGVLHFGAAKGTRKRLDAHVRLDAAGVEVTGYPIAADFPEIACVV